MGKASDYEEGQPQGTRACSRCGKRKAIEEFLDEYNQMRVRCADCRAEDRERYYRERAAGQEWRDPLRDAGPVIDKYLAAGLPRGVLYVVPAMPRLCDRPGERWWMVI